MKNKIDFCDICGEKREVKECGLNDESGYQLYCERCGKENNKKEWIKQAYNIKVNKGKGFEVVGTEYLNYDDDNETKGEKIDEIRKKYNIKGSEWLNISNFFNVYS